jgi:hypothetical protein
VRVHVVRVLLGDVEAGAHLFLERDQAAGGELAGRQVDLDVELAEFGLEGRIGDRVQHRGVAHGRIARVVDQVQFDLKASHRAHLEPRFGQHLGEYVEAAPDLLPEVLPVSPGELGLCHVLAHGTSLTAGAPLRQWRR